MVVALIAGMIVSTTAIAALAWWDLAREERAIFDDFAREQLALSIGIAGELSLRLAWADRDAALIARERDAGREPPLALLAPYDGDAVDPSTPARSIDASDQGALTIHVPIDERRTLALRTSVPALLRDAAKLERAGELLLLMHVPGTTGFFTSTGQHVASPSLEASLAGAPHTLRLSRDESTALGLPWRISYAGIASFLPGSSASIVVVASARRQREREWHAQTRQLSSVLFVGGLVVGVGLAALRVQRRELAVAREEAIAQLRQRRDERLVRASRAAMMGTLATGVAHEIGTPLGVITMRLDQLRAAVEGDERGERHAAAIADQVDHIARIIRGFLSLARGGAPALASLSSIQVIRSAVRLVEHRFDRAHVALIVDAAAAPLEIHGDALLIEHALVNLLLNACAACDDGGRVTITATRDGNDVRFDVVDDGQGITRDDAARATEPFFTTKPIGEGSGLGLAITQEIAAAHRGSFEIAPTGDHGTRATLRLPAARATTSTTSTASITSTTSTTSTTTTARKEESDGDA